MHWFLQEFLHLHMGNVLLGLIIPLRPIITFVKNVLKYLNFKLQWKKIERQNNY